MIGALFGSGEFRPKKCFIIYLPTYINKEKREQTVKEGQDNKWTIHNLGIQQWDTTGSQTRPWNKTSLSHDITCWRHDYCCQYQRWVGPSQGYGPEARSTSNWAAREDQRSRKTNFLFRRPRVEQVAWRCSLSKSDYSVFIYRFVIAPPGRRESVFTSRGLNLPLQNIQLSDHRTWRPLGINIISYPN